MELLEDAQWNKRILSMGCERIDMFLQGGLHEGHLTELVGPSSSGKTQVCLRAASSVAKNYLDSVLFLDTCNSFSPKRIAQIVGQISDSDNKEVNKVIQRVMNSIVYHAVFDIYTLLNVLHRLEFNLRSQKGSQVRLLIVDSISSLISPILGGNGTNGASTCVHITAI
ncbi:unnamed protein product [Ilex paraguariensis]|uniref:RecA family profile 1 domain-containing protein n=1 Tax=Ilex paraguariensis TaxID=185542 RepID=A0ABC8TJN7_9AQUA